MDLFLLVFCFILMLAVLYLLLSRKVSHLADKIFREHYKTHLHRDMTEFYREMESYAVLFENKIQQFKKLLDRQSDQIQLWKAVLTKIKTTKKAKEAIEEVNSMIERGVFTEPIPLKAQPIEKAREKEKLKEVKTPPLVTEDHPIYDQEKDDRIVEQVLDDLLTKEETNKISTVDTKEKSTSHPEKKNSRKNFSSMVDHKLKFERVDAKTRDDQLQNGQRNPTQTSNWRELETDDLLLLLQDLSDNKKKPKALQVLLDQGYKISEISDMANIPYSDLETTKNIYGLESKKY